MEYDFQTFEKFQMVLFISIVGQQCCTSNFENFKCVYLIVAGAPSAARPAAPDHYILLNSMMRTIRTSIEQDGTRNFEESRGRVCDGRSPLLVYGNPSHRLKLASLPQGAPLP